MKVTAVFLVLLLVSGSPAISALLAIIIWIAS